MASKKKKIVVGDNLQNGSLDLYDYCRPALESGSWTISTTQNLVWKEKITGGKQSYSRTQDFEVAGPRFTMNPQDVHAVYPPASGQGYYDNIFPHIVLNKRTLPWERTIDDQAVDPDNIVPWMALMVIEESEIVAQSGKKQQPQSLTVQDLIQPPSSILGPQNLKGVTADDLKESCYTVDVDAKTFMAIVPAENELPYLSHCRKVDLTQKELFAEVSTEDGEGWFSVVVANRMPSSGAKAYACLVSLEGFSDYLYGAADASKVENYTAVRLAVLGFWNFTVLDRNTPSFAYLLNNLDSCSLKMPQVPSGAKEGTPAAFVTDALSDGYIPMTYETRVGEKTVAWYRGPFSPVILKENTDILPFFSAESAMIYDQSTGMFDQSYAAAWQIGRLLALSDQAFSQGLLEWRREQNQKNYAAWKQDNLSEGMKSLLEIPTDSLELVPTAELHKKMRDLLAKKLAGQLVPLDGKPVLKTADPTGFQNRKEGLPGVLSKEELAQGLEEEKGLLQILTDKLFKHS